MSIPIVKRFLGKNFGVAHALYHVTLSRGSNITTRMKFLTPICLSKMVPKMALIWGNGGLNVRFYDRDPEKAHPCAEPRVLAYFASKSIKGPWL